MEFQFPHPLVPVSMKVVIAFMAVVGDALQTYHRCGWDRVYCRTGCCSTSSSSSSAVAVFCTTSLLWAGAGTLEPVQRDGCIAAEQRLHQPRRVDAGGKPPARTRSRAPQHTRQGCGRARRADGERRGHVSCSMQSDATIVASKRTTASRPFLPPEHKRYGRDAGGPSNAFLSNSSMSSF